MSRHYPARPDLLLAAYAVSLGYILRRFDGLPIYDATFVDGLPGDPLSFAMVGTCPIQVRRTADGGWQVWDAAGIGDAGNPRWYADLKDALDAGLALATAR